MKIISNVILVYSLCSTIRFFLLEKLKLDSHATIINLTIYFIQIILILKIFLRLFKVNN